VQTRLFYFSWRALKLAILAVLVIEGAVRIGEGARRLLSRRRPGILERFGVDYLLGIIVLGTAGLGLAAAGLFHPGPLVAVFVCLAMAGFRPDPRMFLCAASLAEFTGRTRARPGGLAGCIALFLGLATSLVWVLVPETEIDSYVSHLGAPDQFLASGRILLDHVQLSMRIPLPVDMTFAYALILGDDRIGKCMSLAGFAAACAVFAAECFRKGSFTASWLGPLMAISLFSVMWQAPITKNDMIGSAMVVSGFLLARRRVYPEGALLLGAGLAVKVVYGPIVAVFCLMYHPSFVGIPLFLLAMALPVLPWMAKEALASGNPAFPFGAGILPTFGWDARNWLAFDLRQQSITMEKITGPLVLASSWWEFWRKESLLLMLCLPGVLLFARRRLEAWLLVAGQLLMLLVSRQPRYLMPATWFIAFLAAEEASRRDPGWRGKVLAVVASAWMIAAVVAGAGDRRGLWGLALADPDAVFTRVMSTYATMTGELRQRGITRLLVVDEFRTYRLPGRVIYSSVLGDTPFIWKAARECRDPAGMRRRFRQLGTDRLLFNYVTAEWAKKYSGSFPWDERMTNLYEDFCRKYMTIETRSRTCTFTGGGFYLFKLRKNPGSNRTVHYMPGAESLEFTAAGQVRNILKNAPCIACEALSRAHPDVLFLRYELGDCLASVQDFQGAYSILKPVAAEGFMSSDILPLLGQVALNIGRLDEAERAFRDGMVSFPEQEQRIRIFLSGLYEQRALDRLKSRDLKGALAALDAAEKTLDFKASDPDERIAMQRRIQLGLVYGFQADIWAALGMRERAAILYRSAIRNAPDCPKAGRWRDELRSLGLEP